MKSNLKKNILIGIVSIAGLLLLAAFGWYLHFNSQFILYQDVHYKFSIKYPNTWRIIMNPRANVAVAFVRPKDTAFDILQENFNVTIQTAPQMDLTLPAFSATVKRQMLAVFGKNITIVEDKPMRWGWREGHLMVIVGPKPNQLRMVNAWLLRGNQAYILTFLGDVNRYPQDALIISEMIHSFQLQ